MLKFQPLSRITVYEALQHPFLEPMHNAEDEPEANFQASFEFESDPSMQVDVIFDMAVTDDV